MLQPKKLRFEEIHCLVQLYSLIFYFIQIFDLCVVLDMQIMSLILFNGITLFYFLIYIVI